MIKATRVGVKKNTVFQKWKIADTYGLMGVSKDAGRVGATKPLFTEDTDQVNRPKQHLLIKAHTLSLPVSAQDTGAACMASMASCHVSSKYVQQDISNSSFFKCLTTRCQKKAYIKFALHSGSNGSTRVYKWILSAQDRRGGDIRETLR